MLQTTMADIAEGGMTPAQSSPVQTVPYDDRVAGNMMCQEAIALCMTHQTSWNQMCHRMFTMTIEARQAFLDAFKAWRKQKTAELLELTDIDKKVLGRAVATATVRISQLTTIAKALTSGMDYETLVDHFKVKDPENLSIDLVVQVARGFKESEARGRKPDPFMVKLVKWLAKNSDTSEDAEKIQAFVNAYVEQVQS
jgi:hypothetical protein